jgi:magnesium transporter
VSLNLAGLKEEEDLFAPVIDSVKNRWSGWPSICAALSPRVIGDSNIPSTSWWRWRP